MNLLEADLGLAVLNHSVDEYLDGYSSDEITEMYYSGNIDKLFDNAEMNRGSARYGEQFRLTRK